MGRRNVRHTLSCVLLNFLLSAPSAALTSDTKLVELGMRLFGDVRLSADHTISCASCHIPERSFADGRRVSLGIRNQQGVRNAPSLVGIVDRTSFFWDGRRRTLEEAVVDPLLNPAEHGLRTLSELERRLQSIPAMEREFQRIRASGSRSSSTPIARVDLYRKSMTTFLRSITVPASPFELYLKGDSGALSAEQVSGLAIFKGAGGCASCHSIDGPKPVLTDEKFHGVGLGIVSGDGVAVATLRAVSLLSGRPLDHVLQIDHELAGLGRFLVTGSPRDVGKFRTPTLRLVSHTGPYMHDGSIATLEEAITQELYYRSLSKGQQIVLSPDERKALLEFLRAL